MTGNNKLKGEKAALELISIRSDLILYLLVLRGYVVRVLGGAVAVNILLRSYPTK